MWERCGVVREEHGLHRGLARLGELAALVPDIDVRPSAEGWADLAQVLDLRAGLLVAEATMRGALARQETRGCHNRSDHPHVDPRMQVNFRTRLDDRGVLVEPEACAVPPMRAELVSWLDQAGPADRAAQLLE
jgi:succinate dehydrogenase / fumarate reductase flavoprotein subunit